jgi:hypothetical protein
MDATVTGWGVFFRLRPRAAISSTSSSVQPDPEMQHEPPRVYRKLIRASLLNTESGDSQIIQNMIHLLQEVDYDEELLN